ncbi:MAG: hypothetical protein ACXVXE_03780, partial [Nocardioidaceae bacterium]
TPTPTPKPSPTPTPKPSPTPTPTPTPTRATAQLDLRSYRATIRRGTSVTLYGHLTTGTRGLAGRRVEIYKWRPVQRRWVLVASGTSLAPTGWYQHRVHPRRTATYKAVFGGGSRYKAATSKQMRITVKR